MKKAIKLLCLMLAVMMCAFAFTACGGDDKTDMEYVKDKGAFLQEYRLRLERYDHQ